MKDSSEPTTDSKLQRGVLPMLFAGIITMLLAELALLGFLVWAAIRVIMAIVNAI